MSMSIVFNSDVAGERPTPKVGDCASRLADTMSIESAANSAGLRAIPIADRSVRRNLPRLNAVVVITRVHAADGDQIPNRWLRVAGVVGAPRRNHRLAAVPRPRLAEARVRARQQ